MDLLKIYSYASIFLTVNYAGIVILFIIGWLRIKTYVADSNTPETAVSVIIAARNEEDKIADTIEDILGQDFPKSFVEIIIIDDHSTDRTVEIVRSYQDNGVKLIQLNETQAINSYKKKAIQTAIGTASGKLIITTDADCRMRKNWLKTIVNYYEKTGCKMISSPVAYFQEKSFFEYAQTLEFSYLIGLGAATIGNKMPSTCNGANLAYEKEAFYQVGGFTGIDDLASGDDELLLHKIASAYKGRIGFLKNNEAVVYTHAKENLAEFIQQRKRWASKSTKYKNKGLVVLGVSVWAFNVSMILNLVWAISVPGWPSLKILAFQLIAKMLLEFVFLFGVSKFFKRMQLLALVPMLSLLHIVYIAYIGVAGNSGKYNWKGRMVN